MCVHTLASSCLSAERLHNELGVGLLLCGEGTCGLFDIASNRSGYVSDTTKCMQANMTNNMALKLIGSDCPTISDTVIAPAHTQKAMDISTFDGFSERRLDRSQYTSSNSAMSAMPDANHKNVSMIILLDL